jgi:alcohol dehydrogenase class IV
MHFFELPSRLYFGRNARLDFLPVLFARGLRRVVVVADENVLRQEQCKQFVESEIPAAGLSVVETFAARSGAEPTYDYLDQSAAKLKGLPFDVIFAVGGGSTLDLAKGLGIVLKNGGRGLDYRGMDRVPAAGFPVVLFPTTAGTGSEVTKTASFIDDADKKKLGINGRHVDAWAGVLDPAFTAACPPGPTLAAGLDALVHCLESFTATTASVLSRDAASLAFPKLFNHLPRVMKNPADLDAREQMMLGAYWAGVAMWNAAGGGPASGISYPLGVLNGVPHGFAGGLLLPHVIRMNVSRGYLGYAPLYRLIDGAKALDDKAASAAFSEAFFALYDVVAAPKNFGRWGVDKNAVPALIEDTMKNRAANLTHNPVPCDRTDVETLLYAVAA